MRQNFVEGGSGMLWDSSARSVLTPSRCIVGGPPQHATVPAVATPPLHSETDRHGVFSHHRCLSLAVPHSMPRYLRSRRRRSTAVCGTGPYTHGPCLHAPLRRPVMRGDPLRHRTQLPSRENIPLPFIPNTRGGITSGGRAPWISCSMPTLLRHLTFWCGRCRWRSAWCGRVWRSSRNLRWHGTRRRRRHSLPSAGRGVPDGRRIDVRCVPVERRVVTRCGATRTCERLGSVARSPSLSESIVRTRRNRIGRGGGRWWTVARVAVVSWSAAGFHSKIIRDFHLYLPLHL